MKRVLIVDDEADFREFVTRVAEGEGFETVAVDSGAELRVAYENFEPDVLVLDIVMPGEDGIEILNWLSGKEYKARILIISGYNPHYRQMAQLLGDAKNLDVASFQKPLRVAELSAALNGTTIDPDG